MGCVNLNEQAELIDLIAQAVVDRIEEREKINRLADIVVARVIALQEEEAILQTETNDSTGRN